MGKKWGIVVQLPSPRIQILGNTHLCFTAHSWGLAEASRPPLLSRVCEIADFMLILFVPHRGLELESLSWAFALRLSPTLPVICVQSAFINYIKHFLHSHRLSSLVGILLALCFSCLYDADET